MESDKKLIYCEICEEKKEFAYKFCGDCQVYFCEFHLTSFHSKGIFKNHKFQNRKEESANQICEIHQKALEFFCENDTSLICYQCALSETHRQHKVEDIKQVAIKGVMGLPSELNKIEQSLKAVKNCEAEIESQLKRIGELRENLQKEMSHLLKEAKEKITDAQYGCGEKVAAISMKRSNELEEQYKILENFRVITKNLLAKIDSTLESENKISLIQYSKGELYDLATRKNISNIESALEKAKKVINDHPTVALDWNLASLIGKSLSQESNFEISENDLLMCNVVYSKKITVLDHSLNEVKFENNELFAKCWSTTELSTEKRHHLIRHDELTKCYWVDFCFEQIGKTKIFLEINGTPLSMCPKTVDVLPSDCKSISTGVYVCKGKNNGCAFQVNTTIYGSNPYYNLTNECAGALHSGAIGLNGGVFYVDVAGPQYIRASNYNGIGSSSVKGHFQNNQIVLKKDCGKMKENIYCCVGKTRGCKYLDQSKLEPVIGSNPYRKDTPLCLAALHAGFITLEGGIFYADETNVNSYSEGKADGYFKDIQSYSDPQGGIGYRLFGLCGAIYKNLFYCKGFLNGCQGKNSGYVFGSNPYTYESDFCGCALHDGAIGENGGFYICNNIGYIPNYTASTKNGVLSLAYQSYQAITIDKYTEGTIKDQPNQDEISVPWYEVCEE